MSSYMNRDYKPWVIVVALIVAIALTVYWTASYPPKLPPRFAYRSVPPHPGDVEVYYTMKTAISTVNIVLLVFLLATYIDIYRRTKSDFTVGLMIFSIILLFYALSSNPFIHWIFGFRAFGLGPFAMLPDLFTCIALAVLVYLTFKY
ncbi:MAG: hypothetical protein FGF53_08370 [Candidatus Brockarchaeota archaeon]|nr:hypothetical protein [Candidatus Brockarchaeota archaeon]